MTEPLALRLILFASLLFLAATIRAAEPPGPATGFIEVPNGRLWYEAKGEGTPIVFLHDGLVSSATWDGQMDAFARHFRAIRYDRRGYGQSYPPKGPYSDVDDLHALFESLKLSRAILVGCSNGSKRAVDYTLAHPDRVEALVLIGPVISGVPYSEHFQRRGMVNFRPMFQEKSREKLIEAWAQDPYLIDAHNTRAKERLRELLTKDPGPLTAPSSHDPERPAAGRLGEIHVPTLIVVGASDIPDVHAQAGVLEAGVKGARRVVFPGAGHLVQMEKPEELNREILGFLRPADAAAEWLASLPPFNLEQSRHLFDYDASAPLDVKEAGTEKRGDVRVVDLSYASPMGGTVPAFLILPPGEGRHSAVLFLHPGQGDRSTFVDEAVGLAARHGFVSLTISAPFLRPENKGRNGGNPWAPEASRTEQIQTIVDLRRGFDLLTSRPEVDTKRLAYVGHSLGATVGGTLAAVEKRPLAFVLMAGFPSLTHAQTDGHGQGALAFQELLTPEQQKAYLDALSPIDAVHYIGHADPAKLLFQFAKTDQFISPWDAEVYVQAASSPKKVKWYDTDHYFNEEARRDREKWLESSL